MSVGELSERDHNLTLAMIFGLRWEGVSDPTIAEKLKFDSVEDMRIQLENWKVPDWLVGQETPTTSGGTGFTKSHRQQQARTSGPLQEVADTRAAADLFSEALDGIARVVEDLEHLSVTYQGKRFAGTYEFEDRWFFPRSSFSEQEWQELCERYGRDPDGGSFYIDEELSKHPLGASPYPPRDLVALIAAYALSDRPLKPLMEVLYPGHSHEHIEEVETLLYQTKRQKDNRDGLRRTAEQFAAAVYGHKVGKGAPVPAPPRDHLLACLITKRREAGMANEEIRRSLISKGYEVSKNEFKRLADLRLRFPGT